MASLFHHSPYKYEPGDIVRLIGRRDRVLGRGVDDLHRIREERFEEIRAQEFPHAVSRLDCNWVYEHLAPALKGMRDGNPDPTANLYTVELVDVKSRCHRGALDILNTDWALAFTRGAKARDELIRTYWRGDGVGPGGTELLVDGELKVVALLQASRPIPEVDVEKLFHLETEEH